MGNSTFLRNPQVRDEASKDLKLIVLSKTEKNTEKGVIHSD